MNELNIPNRDYWGPANAEVLCHETLEEAVYYAYDDECPIEIDGKNAVVVEGGNMLEFPASLFVSKVDDALDYVYQVVFNGRSMLDGIRECVRCIPDDIDELAERNNEYTDPTYFSNKTMKYMERMFRRALSKAVVGDEKSYLRAATDLRRRVDKWARTYPKITVGALIDVETFVVELDSEGEILSVNLLWGDDA